MLPCLTYNLIISLCKPSALSDMSQLNVCAMALIAFLSFFFPQPSGPSDTDKEGYDKAGVKPSLKHLEHVK